MNLKFVVRSLLLGIPLALAIIVAWFVFNSPLAQPLDPTPPPPTIDAPAGPLPPGPAGLRQWARYQGQDYQPVGCGFFLRLPGGEIVAATPAHTVDLARTGAPLLQIALGVPGHSRRWELDTAHRPPGGSGTFHDLASDQLLLPVDEPVDPALVLTPDSRGGPQPGERVVLYSGLGDAEGGPRTFQGTVQSAGEGAVWVVMDGWFNPLSLSGSPLLSLHTGRVVGMLTMGTVGGWRLVLGAVPVRALVAGVQAAGDPVPLVALGGAPD